MQAIVPESLLCLPAPWNRLDSSHRESVLVTDGARRDALEALDRCLQGVAALPHVDPEEVFPEYLTMAWSMWAMWFVEQVPTFDAFRLEPFLEALRKQDPDVDESVVRLYAQVWLREQALDRVRDTQTWLVDAMRANPHDQTLRAMREILRARWRGDEAVTSSLLWDMWTLDRTGSAELLQEIASAPDASPDLAARARELYARG